MASRIKEKYQKEVVAGSQHSSTYDLYVFDIPWTQKFVPYTVPLNTLIKKANSAIVRYNDVYPVMRAAAAWHGQIVGFPFGMRLGVAPIR